MTITDTLRAARLAQKRSVESVAKAIEVHPNTLRYAESRKTRIALETVEAWARELGIELIARPLISALPTPAEASA